MAREVRDDALKGLEVGQKIAPHAVVFEKPVNEEHRFSLTYEVEVDFGFVHGVWSF
jgi:hypothetical protein